MTKRFHIDLFWSDTDSAWVADVPDLRSCSAFSDTPAKALAEVEVAMETWLAIARQDGLPIPEPCYRGAKQTATAPRKPKQPLAASVVAEIPHRLHNAAEAFYFGAILSSTQFYGDGSAPNQHFTVDRSLEDILNSSERRNQVDAPPLVIAFSIELYIKLLRFLSDGQLIEGHNLYELFVQLDQVAQDAGAATIRNHRYARGNRDEFLEYLDEAKAVFERWRYAHEKEFLIATPDNLHALADAFRATMRELHPDCLNVFQRTW